MGNWNDFMQTKRARMLMYAICVGFCAVYAIDAVREMMDPTRSAALIETLGSTTFYLMDAGRALVCLVTGIAFGRMMWKVSSEPDDEDRA